MTCKFAAAVLLFLSAFGSDTLAQAIVEAQGEACGFLIASAADQFRDLLKDGNVPGATKLFIDSQSIGVARILTKGDLVSVVEAANDMVCVRRFSEPSCYWMTRESFGTLRGPG
jgi:hypothetical protein